MFLIYFDTCCLSRLTDDQRQERVRLESGAILRILNRVERGEWLLVRSAAVEEEAGAIRDLQRRARVLLLAHSGSVLVEVGREESDRAAALAGWGFGTFDAVHIAYAEAAGADVLLTTDDSMIKKARRLRSVLRVRVENPFTWLQEVAGT